MIPGETEHTGLSFGLIDHFIFCDVHWYHLFFLFITILSTEMIKLILNRITSIEYLLRYLTLCRSAAVSRSSWRMIILWLDLEYCSMLTISSSFQTVVVVLGSAR